MHYYVQEALWVSRVIAIANQKGGSGKTTTTRSLASSLGERGRSVLMIDLDPQGSLSEGCGVELHSLKDTTYHVLIGAARLSDVIVDIEEHVRLAPTNIHLSAAELQLVNMNRREDRLRNAIKPIRSEYDYILIDCPPSFGLLSVNALSAADSVLIPMTCDYYTLLGVGLLLQTVGEIQREVNPDLKIEGILATRFDGRTLHAKEILQRAKDELGSHVRIFETVVRESVRFKESPILSQSINTYARTSEGARSYRALAEEIDDATPS
jgi:chromosome partitioning protein